MRQYLLLWFSFVFFAGCAIAPSIIDGGEAEMAKAFSVEDLGQTEYECKFYRLLDFSATANNGNWWGLNIIKIASNSEYIFCYVLTEDNSRRQVALYRIARSGEVLRGLLLDVSRPPNIFIDSENIVHIIGHRPFSGKKEHDGYLFHIRFLEPNVVWGEYESEDISPKWRSSRKSISTYSTYYNGCAIFDDNIIVAYDSSINFNQPPYILNSRIWNKDDKAWSRETISSQLPSRFCYPHVQITAERAYVLAIEDQQDSEIGYRYGMMKLFVKEDEWKEETIIDFNKAYNKFEIKAMQLHDVDLFVDSQEDINILIRHKEQKSMRIFYYKKTEYDENWSVHDLGSYQSNWAKFWESRSGHLYIILPKRRSISIVSVETGEELNISIPREMQLAKPVPFVANSRSGSNEREIIDIILYSQNSVSDPVVASINASALQ